MVKFVGSYPRAAIEKVLKKPTRKPVIVVIAYVATDATEMLHLRKDDALVREASDTTVASAATHTHRYGPRQSDISICDFGGPHVV